MSYFLSYLSNKNIKWITTIKTKLWWKNKISKFDVVDMWNSQIRTNDIDHEILVFLFLPNIFTIFTDEYLVRPNFSQQNHSQQQILRFSCTIQHSSTGTICSIMIICNLNSYCFSSMFVYTWLNIRFIQRKKTLWSRYEWIQISDAWGNAEENNCRSIKDYVLVFVM